LRAFIAIEPPAEVRERIHRMQSELSRELRSVRWVSTQNLHLTLRFFGNANESQIGGLIERLETDLRSVDSFPIVFRGVGCFPSIRRPRVLWVSVSVSVSVSGSDPDSDTDTDSGGEQSSSKALDRVQGIVERASRAVDFDAEARSFRPHVTVARFRRRSPRLQRAIAGYEGAEFGEVLVRELVVFESTLLETGARHDVRARIALGRDSGPVGEVGER
jgi:2'-5' RNA ligase